MQRARQQAGAASDVPADVLTARSPAIVGAPSTRGFVTSVRSDGDAP